MNKVHNPSTIAPPVSSYSHAVEVPAGARTLHVSGQIGVRPDGSVAEGVEAQAEQAWQNVIAILADAGMGVADLVRANTFVTRPEHVQVTREVRNRFLGYHRPASTLLVVAALATPDYLFELEVVAAKA